MKIRAECHSDDHVVRVEFNAASWFDQATDDDIKRLVDCGWAHDYPADNVAEFFADTTTADLFGYLDITRRQRARPTIGFECSVNEDDARAWLSENRPALLESLS